MADAPEKNTHQLAPWWRLVDALEQLGATWEETQTTGDMADSGQLPANLAVALAGAGLRGAQITADVAGVLSHQFDSGGRFVELARAARMVSDGWPRTDRYAPADPATNHTAYRDPVPTARAQHQNGTL